MAKATILIVEDDVDISEMVVYNLEKEGYRTCAVYDGDDALDAVRSHKPDLILLDIMLPGKDGLQLCTHIRRDEEVEDIPIIMLSAKSQESDKIVGLELGADDYVTKPFSPKELVARVKALLRRQKKAEGAKDIVVTKEIVVGEVVLNTEKYKVFVQGAEVSLTATEFKLLHLLMSRPGIVVSRDEILDQIFGYTSSSYDRTVDAHVKALRKKLGAMKNYIETVRGVGYRCKEVL